MDNLIEKFISADPEIHHGKPCFLHTRIPVYAVLELLEGGTSWEAVVGPDYYPALTRDHIRAALHYAAQAAKNEEYVPFKKSA
jgi:uncharacterized protein (DUF433 family)